MSSLDVFNGFAGPIMLYGLAGFGAIRGVIPVFKLAVRELCDLVIFVCDEWRRVKRHLSAEPSGDPVVDAEDEP